MTKQKIKQSVHYNYSNKVSVSSQVRTVQYIICILPEGCAIRPLLRFRLKRRRQLGDNIMALLFLVFDHDGRDYTRVVYKEQN